MTTLDRKQRGFTLLEVSIAMAIAISALLSFVPYYTKLMERGLVEQTSHRARIVYESAVRFRSDTGAWPANTAALVAGNYIPATASTTSWGGAINLVPSGANMNMTLTLPDIRFVSSVAGRMPAPSIAGNTITEVIVPPGEEASLAALQDLAGTRAWTGNYNAGGNSLTNVQNVTGTGTFTANTFADSEDSTDFLNPAGRSQIETLDVRSIRDRDNSAYTLDPSSTSRLNYVDANLLRLRNDYVEGGSCTTEVVGTTSTGELMSCVSGRWTKPGSGATSGSNSRGYWRRHADGYLEQWGYRSPNNSWLTITFPIRFSNSNYSFQTSRYYHTVYSSAAINYIRRGSKSASSITVSAYSTVGGVEWYAAGY